MIISSVNDPHCDAVSHWLRNQERAEPVVFDFQDFPVRSAIAFESGSQLRLRLPGIGTIAADEVAGVWWRRPRSFTFDEAIIDPGIQRFCEVNCQHAIQGFIQTFSERVIDPIFRVEAANRKLFQLQLAEQCGLKIPPTCVTNDPKTARAFIKSRESRVVYKILRGDESHYVGTTLLDSADVESLNLLRHCPVIFQHFVEPGFDIRITVVGNSVFPAKLTSQKPAGLYDIRRDTTCEIQEYELPREVEGGVRLLVTRLGLRFAAIDMRANGLGEHYFLEVNPAGQYLFVETATNQPITAALARLLADPCP